MKKLNLLQQALVEEKKLSLAKRANELKKALKPSEILDVLLPNYKPQPKQLKFHNSRSYEKGLKGGYGSGKTLPLCAEAILLSYINRPLSVIVSSPTEDTIKQTTYETIKNLLNENGIEFEWLETKGHFRIFFGSRKDETGNIYLIGQKFFKGPNVAAVGFDEPFSQKKETYNNLIARARNPKAKRLEVFWAGTAEPGKMEWGFSYFEKDEDSPDLFSITLATKENKFLPKGFIESLKRKYDARLQEVYLEGKLILLSANPVYHAFDRKKNLFQEYFDLAKADETIIGFDFNVDPMSAAVITLKDFTFRQAKEFSLNNSNTVELCTAVIAYLKSQETGSQYKSIIITGDASGRRRGTRGYFSDYEIIRDEFMKAGIPFYFNIPQDNPAVRDRVNFVNKLFESGRFLIHESCQKTIKDRELVTWKQSGEGFMIDKSKKDLTHLSDAADYGVWNCQMLLESNLNDRIFVSYNKR